MKATELINLLNDIKRGYKKHHYKSAEARELMKKEYRAKKEYMEKHGKQSLLDDVLFAGKKKKGTSSRGTARYGS